MSSSLASIFGSAPKFAAKKPVVDASLPVKKAPELRKGKAKKKKKVTIAAPVDVKGDEPSSKRTPYPEASVEEKEEAPVRTEKKPTTFFDSSLEKLPREEARKLRKQLRKQKKQKLTQMKEFVDSQAKEFNPHAEEGDDEDEGDARTRYGTADGAEEEEHVDTRTLFVGNVDLRTNEKMLIKHFRTHGAVESARLRSMPFASVTQDSKKQKLRKNFHKLRKTCNAYVVFKNKEGVEAALSAPKESMVLFERSLRLDRVGKTANSRYDPAVTLFIGNCPLDLEDEELRVAFDSVDGVEVDKVRVVRDGETRVGKGFAFVVLTAAECVEAALDAHSASPWKIRDRELRVSQASHQPKRSLRKFNKKVDRTKDLRMRQLQAENRRRRGKRPINRADGSMSWQGATAEPGMQPSRRAVSTSRRDAFTIRKARAAKKKGTASKPKAE